MFQVQSIRQQLGRLADLLHEKGAVLVIGFDQGLIIGQDLYRSAVPLVRVAAIGLDSSAVGLEQFNGLSQGVKYRRQQQQTRLK